MSPTLERKVPKGELGTERKMLPGMILGSGIGWRRKLGEARAQFGL